MTHKDSTGDSFCFPKMDNIFLTKKKKNSEFLFFMATRWTGNRLFFMDSLIYETDLADIYTVSMRTFGKFTATIAISFVVRIRESTVWHTKLPVFDQNFKTPCVFPNTNREFFCPFFLQR